MKTKINTEPIDDIGSPINCHHLVFYLFNFFSSKQEKVPGKRYGCPWGPSDLYQLATYGNSCSSPVRLKKNRNRKNMKKANM